MGRMHWLSVAGCIVCAAQLEHKLWRCGYTAHAFRIKLTASGYCTTGDHMLSCCISPPFRLNCTSYEIKQFSSSIVSQRKLLLMQNCCYGLIG